MLDFLSFFLAFTFLSLSLLSLSLVLVFTTPFGDPFLVRLLLFLSSFYFYTRIYTFVDGLLAGYDFCQGYSRFASDAELIKARLCILFAGLLLTIALLCNGQFLTPDQLREQHDLGYGARTHYEMSGSRLTDAFRRVNPDYLLRGRSLHNRTCTHPVRFFSPSLF